MLQPLNWSEQSQAVVCAWFISPHAAKDYTSTWHVFRKKNSLLNRANLRNNEEDVKLSVLNTVAFIKCVPTLTSFPATSYQCFLSQPLLQIANFDSEKTHDEYIFERQDILHFCSEISQDYENAKKVR